MITLSDIERKYSISYPKLYKELDKKNMLDWGEFGFNWKKEVYPKLKKNPPLLLFSIEFEIINFEHIDEEIEAFKDHDDFRETNPEFNFIPFAQTGAGDLYCFQFDKEENGNVPIVLVWHDDNRVDVLAKNLQDFIFRFILEMLIDIESEFSLLTEGNKYKNLINYQKTHLKFLTETQQKIIIKWCDLFIANKRFFSKEEQEGILHDMNQEINFFELNSEFEYQK